MEWNGNFSLDSRLLCLAERHSMAGQRTSRVWWGTKVLGQNPSIRHPHHARQICKTSRKPRFSIVLQTTLHMLGKFARLPNSRSFRLSYKLPCRFVLIWKHLKSVTKVLNKIRENMKMSSLSQTKTRIRSHLDFHRKWKVISVFTRSHRNSNWNKK